MIPSGDRGRSIVDWQRFDSPDSAGHVVCLAEPDPPLDAMRYTYLSASLSSAECESGGTVRFSWENSEGERFTGPTLPLGESHVYIRDDPRWQGLLFRLILESSAPFDLRSFTLFGEKDLSFEEKLAWPSDFALIPRRRVIGANESLEGRLIVPNRLLRALGENQVVFTVSDPGNHVLAEKRIHGRQPVESWGITDFFSGALGSVPVTGRLSMTARVLDTSIAAPLEETVALYSAGDRHLEVFCDPHHYVNDFTVIRAEDQFHLFYTVGQADGRQAEDAPRAAREIGHATSSELTSWSIQPRVLAVERGSDTEVSVRSPVALAVDGGFALFYSAASAGGAEYLRRADSKDLFAWEHRDDVEFRPNAAWADWSADRPSLCRNATLMRWGDVWVMHYNGRRKRDGALCVAAALSEDLLHWVDAGPVISGGRDNASPVCIEVENRLLLLTDGDAYTSADPLREWEPTAGTRAAGWRGWEFVRHGESWRALAYRHVTRGNFVQAFPVELGPAGPEIDMRDAVPV